MKNASKDINLAYKHLLRLQAKSEVADLNKEDIHQLDQLLIQIRSYEYADNYENADK